MYIPIIIGTGRINRRSESVAKKILQITTERGIESDLIDVRDSGLTVTDNKSESESRLKWQSTLKRCTGFIIVLPEYNHGYPGELKLFLDQTFNEYENKIVGIVSVSFGLWGGTRAAEQLRLVLNAFNLIVLGMALHLRNIGQMINEKGEYNNPELPQFANLMLDKIIHLGSKLTPDTKTNVVH